MIKLIIGLILIGILYLMYKEYRKEAAKEKPIEDAFEILDEVTQQHRIMDVNEVVEEAQKELAARMEKSDD